MKEDSVVRVRPFRPADAGQYMELRRLLWPQCSTEDHIKDIASFLNRPEDNAVYVAADPKENLYGFVEVGLRPYAEGCKSSPVGYVEGWYVAPARRGRGMGRSLFEAAEGWAQRKGLKEMASDTEIENEGGRKAHEALGYRRTQTLHCFAKDLPGSVSA